MEIRLDMPSAVEGSWVLTDSAGKLLATSKEHPNSVLTVVPHFYRYQQTQTVFRAEVTGKSGRQMRQFVKIGGGAGKLLAERMEDIPKPMVPGFDRPAPDPTKGKKNVKQDAE